MHDLCNLSSKFTYYFLFFLSCFYFRIPYRSNTERNSLPEICTHSPPASPSEHRSFPRSSSPSLLSSPVSPRLSPCLPPKTNKSLNRRPSKNLSLDDSQLVSSNRTLQPCFYNTYSAHNASYSPRESLTDTSGGNNNSSISSTYMSGNTSMTMGNSSTYISSRGCSSSNVFCSTYPSAAPRRLSHSISSDSILTADEHTQPPHSPDAATLTEQYGMG